ncbi:MAG: PP2C family serine/threonine-protein phosphatase [bacterium]
MKAKGLTDIGKIKENNEDKFYINDDICLYMVSDGMGGHNSGEVASEMVINSFIKEIVDNKKTDLSQICTITNDLLVKTGESDPKYHKMGATLVLLMKSMKGIVTLNLGDSRIYQISKRKRKWKITQLTHDQTMIAELLRNKKITEEEAKEHPWRHIISKYFGNPKGNNSCEIKLIENYDIGDFFLLCSDGLSNMVDDEKILEIVSKNGLESVKNLIDLANETGGEDNITAVVVQMEKKDKPKDYFPTFRRMFKLLSVNKRKKEL